MEKRNIVQALGCDEKIGQIHNNILVNSEKSGLNIKMLSYLGAYVALSRFDSRLKRLVFDIQ